MKWKIEYDAVLASGMFWEWFPKLSGEWEKDKDDFIEELKTYRNVGNGYKPNTKFREEVEDVNIEMFNDAKPNKISWRDAPPIVTGTPGGDVFLCDEIGQCDARTRRDLIMGHWSNEKKPKGWIQLEIYHAEGYFVGEWRMEPETSGRRVLTKTGWKGVRDFVNDYQPEDFLVTYNGVKYETENNAELFKKIFNGH